MVLFWMAVTLLLLAWFVRFQLWHVRPRLNHELAKGRNLTLGVMGAGTKQDYIELLNYAVLHPGRVCISVKRGHMSIEDIVSISTQVPRVWIAAKYSDDRWRELKLAERAKTMGGNVGITIAAYNEDAPALLEEALSHGISIRIVKGYYSGSLTNQQDIDGMFLQLAKRLVLHARITGQIHLIATHDTHIISQLEGMGVPPSIHLAQYWNRDERTPKLRGVQLDLLVSTGRVGKTFLSEVWWVRRPSALIRI